MSQIQLSDLPNRFPREWQKIQARMAEITKETQLTPHPISAQVVIRSRDKFLEVGCMLDAEVELGQPTSIVLINTQVLPVMQAVS